MPINNRELSQFGSFITIDDASKSIGIAAEATPKVGIGTEIASHKFTVYGNSSFVGDVTFTGDVDITGSFSFDDIVVSGISTFNGNVSVGNTSTDTITLTSSVNSDIVPSSNGTLNLGSNSNRWETLYCNNIVGTANSATKVAIGSTGDNSNYSLLFANFSGDPFSVVYTDLDILYNPNTNTLNTTNVSSTNLVVSGVSTFNGNVSVGNSSSDTITFTSRVNSDVVPSADGTVSLGSSTNKWNKIYANEYENFKFSDLPTVSESTFAPERLLKTKADGTGYELIDIFTLGSSIVQSFNISNDGTVYAGIGSTVSNKLQISEIPTVKFYVGEKVKVFGITSFTDNTLVDPPITASSSASKIGTSSTVSTYRYWIAQYHLRNGKVGVSSQISPTEGIGMASIDNFNDVDFISLNLARTDTNHGILIYRQTGISTDIDQTKLIAILGPKELGSLTSGITWNDYGTYEQPEWSLKGTSNEYGPEQIHFPNIATTGHRRGWAIDTISAINGNTITLSGQYKTNLGIGTTSSVKVVHDNTYAFKSAIESAVAIGKNSLELPSGTYLTNKLTLPSGFTLSGNGKNTIVKLQYFASDSTDGAGNSLSLNGNLVGVGTTNPSEITIRDISFDGNNYNNILYANDSQNYLLNLDSISSSLIKGVDIKNSLGHGLYVYNSRRLSLENSSVVDGSITDRESYQPLNAQESETIRVNDCLFENYSGPVDLSVTTVALAAGNIIRNCGTGLKIYAAGKITTSNNIILGPSDEYIPSPDIYDSDYNSVNFTVQRGLDFTGPVLQYIENGEPKDISSTQVAIVSAGIGTIVGQGTTNETLGSRFLDFNIITPNTGTFGRQNGYIQLSLNATQTSSLGLTSSLGYDIIAKEFLSKPTGFTTYIGISTGTWNTIGAGATQYTVTLDDYNQFSGISTGDVVKLVNHSVSPDISSVEFTVSQKIDVNFNTKRVVLTGITTTSISNGANTGYISIRNLFTIAKGRVGVI